MSLWIGGGLVGCEEESPPAVATREATPTPESQPEPPAPESDEPEVVLPKTPASFEDAVAAAKKLWKHHGRTLFCGCSYTTDGRTARSSCGYRTRADESLAKHVRWERVVPARRFGATRSCWGGEPCHDDDDARSGVECCAATDPVFAAMQADLHNIAPVVAEIAQDRSNFGFGEIEGETRLYGSCDFEVDRASGVAEPDRDARGVVARAYLYMNATYPEAMGLAPDELQTFQAWHRANPPKQWEIERNARIAAIQGKPNPFVPMGRATERVAVAQSESDDENTPAESERELTAREAIFKVGRAAPAAQAAGPGAGGP